MADSHYAFFSLGSNIDPEVNLPLAAQRLAESGRRAMVSTVWQTRAIGPDGQISSVDPDYLNAALYLETSKSIATLRRSIIPDIESQLGRERDPNNRYAPRTIDIDLVLYDDCLSATGDPIPDPDILTRPYLAFGLAELAPDYIHPETRQSLREIAAGFWSRKGELLGRPDVRLLSETEHDSRPT